MEMNYSKYAEPGRAHISRYYLWLPFPRSYTVERMARIFPISDTDDIEMLPMWTTHILRAQRGHSAHLVVGTLLATRAVCDSNKDTRVVRKICFILLERDIEYIIGMRHLVCCNTHSGAISPRFKPIP